MEIQTSKKVKKVIYRKCEWSPYLEDLINKKLQPDAPPSFIKKKVEDGDIMLFQLLGDDLPLGYFFMRVDRRYDGEKELVLLYSIAEEKIATRIHPHIAVLGEKIAKENGIGFIRVHSELPSTARLITKYGYTFRENVFEKKIEL